MSSLAEWSCCPSPSRPVLVHASSAQVFHGTLTGINAALKYILFKPSPDFFGTAYLNVHVDDMGGYPSPAQVSVLPIPITVRPQQDNIHLGASPESVTTAEDVALLLPLPLLTDADPVAKVTVNMTLLNGTLTFTSTTGVTVYTLAPKTYMLQGSLTDVNTQLGQVCLSDAISGRNRWGEFQDERRAVILEPSVCFKVRTALTDRSTGYRPMPAASSQFGP